MMTGDDGKHRIIDEYHLLTERQAEANAIAVATALEVKAAALAKEVQNQTALIADKRRRDNLVALVLVALFGLALFFVYQSSQDAGRSADILVDCNTPSTPTEPHPCADRQQQRLAGAIEQLQKIVIAANECSADPLTTSDVLPCVQRKLGPVPTPTAGP